MQLVGDAAGAFTSQLETTLRTFYFVSKKVGGGVQEIVHGTIRILCEVRGVPNLRDAFTMHLGDGEIGKDGKPLLLSWCKPNEPHPR